MSRIILAPGQGAQAVSMAKAWCDASAEARAVFQQADDILKSRLPGQAAGLSLSQVCFEGPAEILNRTDVSQPAIFTASVACWRGLLAAWGCGGSISGSAAGVKEAKVLGAAGLSLGEYTALHLAGVFSFADGLELVALRGKAMQEAAEAVPSGMVALIGADEAKATSLCDAARGSDVLVCANFNAPGQIVISGSKAACERAVAMAGEHGVRGQALAVAGAFHSPIMQPAAERLAAKLAATPMQAPESGVTVYSNVTAKPHEPSVASIRDLLVRQLTSPVRWAESCAAIAVNPAFAGATYHELAPGKTLTGLYKRINRDVTVTNHDAPG